MEYDIIEEMTDLAVSGVKLEVKLAHAARVFLEKFPFDQCLVYVWDGEAGSLSLKASKGTGVSVGRYAVGEGLPGLVMAKGVPVYISLKHPLWKKSGDGGLEGFGYGAAFPVKDKSAFYGIVFLKAKKAPKLGARDKVFLEVSALQLASFFRCSELIKTHQRVFSDLREVQMRLANAEKLMTLGDMAATLAHEIRSPIISIGGFAARLKKHMPPNSPDLPFVEQMTHEVARLEKIMDGIIRFLKDSAVELKPDDLNSVMEEALELFDEELATGSIRLVKDLYKGALPVLADRDQLKIAFDNLIANAIQSMEKGGTLTVSTSRTGEAVFAKISDSGGGIDPKILDYIFNPFFTTKKHGTGLGLPITNSIIMRHKGVIEVINNEGVGAVFVLKFPIAA